MELLETKFQLKVPPLDINYGKKKKCVCVCVFQWLANKKCSTRKDRRSAEDMKKCNIKKCKTWKHQTSMSDGEGALEAGRIRRGGEQGRRGGEWVMSRDPWQGC